MLQFDVCVCMCVYEAVVAPVSIRVMMKLKKEKDRRGSVILPPSLDGGRITEGMRG